MVVQAINVGRASLVVSDWNGYKDLFPMAYMAAVSLLMVFTSRHLIFPCLESSVGNSRVLLLRSLAQLIHVDMDQAEHDIFTLLLFCISTNMGRAAQIHARDHFSGPVVMQQHRDPFENSMQGVSRFRRCYT